MDSLSEMHMLNYEQEYMQKLAITKEIDKVQKEYDREANLSEEFRRISMENSDREMAIRLETESAILKAEIGFFLDQKREADNNLQILSDDKMKNEKQKDDITEVLKKLAIFLDI